METITQLTPAWRDWIQLNVARGCSPQSMVDNMVRGGFDPACARIAVNAAVANGGAVPAPMLAQSYADTYLYEKSRLPEANVIRTSDRDVRVVFRVNQPRIAVLENVLSDAECDELIQRSTHQLSRSSTIDPLSGNHEVIADRTSEGTFFEVSADDFIARLDRRIGEIMHWPVDHGEGLQVLHYHVGGEYKPHFDFFPLEHPGSHVQLGVGGQRVATLVMYLNDVEQGGATIFPELGLEILPKKGSAVYFDYSNSLGQNDRKTLHGGAPIVQGEKWIMTKWMRQRRYGSVAAPAEELTVTA